MSCSPFDLKDYCLKELAEAERRQVETHLQACAGCREEVERLRLTEAALFSLRDEEIPQRIAFVSDKIFEPSPWRRGWEAFWGSAARLGFASAALLSVALIVFSLSRAAGNPAVPSAARVISSASVPDTEIQQQIQKAVDQAVAARDAHVQELEQKVSEISRRNQEQDKLLQRAADAYDYLERQNRLMARVSFGPPAEVGGDSK